MLGKNWSIKIIHIHLLEKWEDGSHEPNVCMLDVRLDGHLVGRMVCPVIVLTFYIMYKFLYAL